MEKAANLHSSNLYLSHIPFTYSEADIEALFFPKYIVKSLRLLHEGDEPGKRGPSGSLSRGAGFVRLASRVQAQEAVQELNGKLLPGHQMLDSGYVETLQVRFADSETQKIIKSKEKERQRPPYLSTEPLEQAQHCIPARLMVSSILEQQNLPPQPELVGYPLVHNNARPHPDHINLFSSKALSSPSAYSPNPTSPFTNPNSSPEWYSSFSSASTTSCSPDTPQLPLAPMPFPNYQQYQQTCQFPPGRNAAPLDPLQQALGSLTGQHASSLAFPYPIPAYSNSYVPLPDMHPISSLPQVQHCTPAQITQAIDRLKQQQLDLQIQTNQLQSHILQQTCSSLTTRLSHLSSSPMQRENSDHGALDSYKFGTHSSPSSNLLAGCVGLGYSDVSPLLRNDHHVAPYNGSAVSYPTEVFDPTLTFLQSQPGLNNFNSPLNHNAIPATLSALTRRSSILDGIPEMQEKLASSLQLNMQDTSASAGKRGHRKSLSSSKQSSSGSLSFSTSSQSSTSASTIATPAAPHRDVRANDHDNALQVREKIILPFSKDLRSYSTVGLGQRCTPESEEEGHPTERPNFIRRRSSHIGTSSGPFLVRPPRRLSSALRLHQNSFEALDETVEPLSSPSKPEDIDSDVDSHLTQINPTFTFGSSYASTPNATEREDYPNLSPSTELQQQTNIEFSQWRKNSKGDSEMSSEVNEDIEYDSQSELYYQAYRSSVWLSSVEKKESLRNLLGRKGSLPSGM